VSIANAPKTQLGRFQLVRHLASGGMTELWLAKSPTATNVAIKRVRFVQAFLDEVRVATTLRHANIAVVHDVGLDHGEYYVATDWVHGVDLRHLLAYACANEQQLPIEHAMTIALATASALKHAHAHGTVHSDVAPANIVVGFDGVVKMIDFGLAKATHRTRETQPGVTKGRIAYMAPEQSVGQAVDSRSDIYSLGIVLYELVTVRRLFKAPNDFLTMTAILHGEIPLPSTVRAGIPRELDAIIMTALARDPDQRFQSVEEMRTALEELCAAKHIRTSPAVVAEYLRKAFGKQAEPWIASAPPADFDGALPGIVPIPEAAVQGALATPMRAVATPAVGDEATDIVAPLPLLDLTEANLEVGDSTMLVRSSPKSVRRMRLGLLALVALMAIAGAVLFVVLRETDDDDPRQRANPNIKLPPPSNPAPVVLPPLAADAAVEEETVVPAPVVAPPPVKIDTVHKKKKKKVKRPTRRPRKAAEPPTESAWDRESLFPK
jgi:eukaryotic-like serine/threonine-protein kinase